MLSEWFIDSVIIQGHIPATGEWGDKGIWFDKSVVMGRMRVLTNDERKLDDKGSIVATHRFYLPIGTEVYETDRFFVAGRYYDIYDVRMFRDKGGVGRYLIADAIHLDGQEEDLS